MVNGGLVLTVNGAPARSRAEQGAMKEIGFRLAVAVLPAHNFVTRVHAMALS